MPKLRGSLLGLQASRDWVTERRTEASVNVPKAMARAYSDAGQQVPEQFFHRVDPSLTRSNVQ
jgi:hypothetical protein